MKKFKKVLGLIAIAGLCVLGLASCNNGKVKVPGIGYDEKQHKDVEKEMTGELYKNNNQYILITDDGLIYSWNNKEFRKAGEMLDSEFCQIWGSYFIKTEKHLVVLSNSMYFYERIYEVPDVKQE